MQDNINLGDIVVKNQVFGAVTE